jgi:predicted pyridoxine 5'-phosphate oxidase superfamily flavin-nucleotide-binding protein
MKAMAETGTGRAFARLVFSDAVKATQARYGVRERAAMLETAAASNDVLTDVPRAFLETCDSFVIASAGRNLWPHVQHRGGPRGCLKCLDDRTLAFGDFDGNRQFLTLGNIAENPRVAIVVDHYEDDWSHLA